MGGRQFLEQYFVVVNTLYFHILLETVQEIKRTDINLFKNTKAPQSAPVFQSENMIRISLIFRQIIRFYEKMNKAQMKQTES